MMKYFILLTIAATACAHFSLPNRNHQLCNIPWDKRDPCLTDSDCDGLPMHICAHRGQVIGKCTYIECCDPWRNGPRLMNGADWCSHKLEAQ